MHYMHTDLQPLPDKFKARFISIDRSVLLYSADEKTLSGFVNVFDQNFNWGYKGHDTNNLLFSLYMGVIAPYKGATATGVIQMPTQLRRTPKVDEQTFNDKLRAQEASIKMYENHRAWIHNLVITELTDPESKVHKEHMPYLNALSAILLTIPEMGVFDIAFTKMPSSPWLAWEVIKL